MKAFVFPVVALTFGLFGLSSADLVLVLQDAKKNPIAGVSCSQAGGPTGISDASGRIQLNGIVGLRGGLARSESPRKAALSQVPIAPGQSARITVTDLRGRRVFDRRLGLDERIAFTGRDKGLYLVTVAGDGRTVRGQVLNMGAGLEFEGIRPVADVGLVKAARPQADLAAIVCSKQGFITQVYKAVDGTTLTVDFSTPKIIPLYDAASKLEPEVHYDRGDAIITQWADRGRDRHAKEDQFQSYDHYLNHYWIHRTARTILTDRVTKGGNSIDVSWVTEWMLDKLPEFRAWYSGKGSVAQYYGNYAPLFKKEGPGTYDMDHKKISDVGNQYKYTYTIKTAIMLDGKEAPLAVGQFMEIEASQFLEGVPEGRDNYYGTTYLYEVGTGGMVPWYTVGTWADQTSERENSHKIDEVAWLGGRTTLPYNYTDEPDNHYMQMATNLSGLNGQPFVQGRRVLHTNFINGVHDEPDNPVWEENMGKGGTNYVNITCNSCHVRNGRGRTPEVNGPMYQSVVKVGDANGNPHPKLGGVLQPQATAGAAEGSAMLSGWSEANGLRKPAYAFAGGTVPTNYSVRATPPLVGMGLLEAIPETVIQGLEDPDDANGDGISGRANIVSDLETGEPRLGRFGWKAGKGRVAHQIAGAFNTDMGVMTSLLPKPDCGSQQENCGPSGNELADSSLQNLITYVSLLGVRARRDYKDPEALQGEALFTNAGCVSCHTPTLKTSAYHPKAELRNQTIHPFTDLLLHDMGPGLADNLPEGMATGAEWRTQPLWGLGLSACVTGGVEGVFQKQTCTPHHSYLHDGRARSIEEAILWHGGEAAKAAERYKAMSKDETAALLKFLGTL